MKKLISIFFTICLCFISPSVSADTNFDTDINEVFKLDIKTLKYEQKQLVYAILVGDEKSVRTILDSDPEPKTTYAKIPLTMFAIHENNVEILKILIEEYNFDPNQKVMDVTPIEIAIALKKYECIKYLLSIGVKPGEEVLKAVKKSKNKKLKALFE